MIGTPVTIKLAPSPNSKSGVNNQSTRANDPASRAFRPRPSSFTAMALFRKRATRTVEQIIRRFDVVWQDFNTSFHEAMESQNQRFAATFFGTSELF